MFIEERIREEKIYRNDRQERYWISMKLVWFDEKNIFFKIIQWNNEHSLC